MTQLFDSQSDSTFNVVSPGFNTANMVKLQKLIFQNQSMCQESRGLHFYDHLVVHSLS